MVRSKGYTLPVKFDIETISLALNMTYFFLHVILNAVKKPTEEPTRCILYSLWSWNISLALNMTYFFFTRHSERSEESHRRTDEVYTLLTLVVGYFACAQYDVRLASSFGGSVGNADDRG